MKTAWEKGSTTETPVRHKNDFKTSLPFFFSFWKCPKLGSVGRRETEKKKGMTKWSSRLHLVGTTFVLKPCIVSERMGKNRNLRWSNAEKKLKVPVTLIATLLFPKGAANKMAARWSLFSSPLRQNDVNCNLHHVKSEGFQYLSTFVMISWKILLKDDL